MRRLTRQLATSAALATLGTGLLAACATRAPADSIVLYYQSGAGENREWAECIEPGQSGSYPVDDETFALPTSQRTWNIRPDGGDSNVPIRTGSRPQPTLGSDGKPTGATQAGPEMLVWTTADFYLNTDCRAGRDSPVVRFWENTGRRYGVSTDGEDGFSADGWRAMLTNTLVPAQEKTVREQSRLYAADDLDANVNNVWLAVERQLGPEFNQQLRERMGGDYFCGTGYARGDEVAWKEWEQDGTDAAGLPRFREVERRGTCPPVRITITDVGFADPKIADARAAVYAAEQEAKAKLTAAKAELDQANLLGQAASNDAYVRYKEVEARLKAAEACRTNANCTVIIDGGGSVGVTVPGGR